MSDELFTTLRILQVLADYSSGDNDYLGGRLTVTVVDGEALRVHLQPRDAGLPASTRWLYLGDG